VRATLIAAIVFGAACTPAAVEVSPSVAPSSALSSAPTASLTSSASAGLADAAPGADWPSVTLYTVTDDGVAHTVSRAGTTDIGQVCEGRALGVLARGDGAAVLVRCISSITDQEAPTILDVASRRTTHLAAHPIGSFSLRGLPMVAR
jgi:hypothetical protein